MVDAVAEPQRVPASAVLDAPHPARGERIAGHAHRRGSDACQRDEPPPVARSLAPSERTGAGSAEHEERGAHQHSQVRAEEERRAVRGGFHGNLPYGLVRTRQSRYDHDERDEEDDGDDAGESAGSVE